MNLPPSVYIVDDDRDMRDSLHCLIEAAGYAVRSFASAQDFLAEFCEDWTGCLIADQQMPGIKGIELIEELHERVADPLPAILITAYSNIPVAVSAIKTGAVEFLEKPVDKYTLLRAVEAALELDAKRCVRRQRQLDLQQKYDQLTPREVETLDLIRQGLANKVMAAQLGITERAVEMRRAGIMKKMGASSIAELLESVISLRFIQGEVDGGS